MTLTADARRDAVSARTAKATATAQRKPVDDRPVEFWPTAAIRAALETDDLSVWQNIVAILAAAGMKITDLVKITSYLTSLASFPAYAAGRAKFLAGHRPASTSLVVGSLVKPEYLVEVEAIAAKAAPAPKTRKPASRKAPKRAAAKRKKKPGA